MTSAKPACILVVDDVLMNRLLLQAILAPEAQAHGIGIV